MSKSLFNFGVFKAARLPHDVSPYVVLRLDQPCGCKTFYPVRLSAYRAEPALSVLTFVGVYPSEEAANDAARDAAAAAQREMHS